MKTLIENPEPVVATPSPEAESPEAPSPEASLLTMRAALDQRRDFLIEMPDEKVQRNLRLDVKVSGAIVSGAVSMVMPHRDAIAAQFGDEGVAAVDELPGAVYACMQAEVELTNAESGVELAALADVVAGSHRYMINELESLAFRKLLDGSRIDAGRPVQGYRQLVSSSITLIDLVRTILPQVAGKTSITMEQLVEIERGTTQMFEMMNARGLGGARMPAAELRTRALSHLVSVYDQVRRMVAYVRWSEGDADEIAPSLYAARRGFRRASSEPTADPTPSDPTPPVTPMDPVPGSGPAPFTP